MNEGYLPGKHLMTTAVLLRPDLIIKEEKEKNNDVKPYNASLEKQNKAEQHSLRELI